MDNNNGVIPGFDNDKDDSLTISLRKAEGVPHVYRYLQLQLLSKTNTESNGCRVY